MKAILLIVIYIISTVINFLPSIKYPDVNATWIGLIISVLFAVYLVLFIKTKRLKTKPKKIMLLSAVFAGILNFATGQFFILDFINGFSTALYVLFVTPLFGFNFITNVNYGLFSLICSAFYFIVLLVNRKNID